MEDGCFCVREISYLLGKNGKETKPWVHPCNKIITMLTCRFFFKPPMKVYAVEGISACKGKCGIYNAARVLDMCVPWSGSSGLRIPPFSPAPISVLSGKSRGRLLLLF